MISQKHLIWALLLINMLGFVSGCRNAKLTKNWEYAKFVSSTSFKPNDHSQAFAVEIPQTGNQSKVFSGNELQAVLIEAKIINHNENSNKSDFFIFDGLNAFGRRGWEIIDVSRLEKEDQFSVEYLFKR